MAAPLQPKAPPKTQLAPIDTVRQQLTQMEPQFKMALPPQIASEKFMRVTLSAVQNNPDLLSANRHSLYSACMKAAADGLLPDGREAAMVTFKNKSGELTVTYMPMVGGILKKVRNSGELVSIHAELVYEKDKFRYWHDTSGTHLEHEPMLFGECGNVLGAYAIAITKGGGTYIDVMTTAEIEKTRAVSRARSGPWVDWWEEMAKKTVIKRLSKRLPMSTDIQDLVSPEDDEPEPPPAAALPKPAAPKRVEALVASVMESMPDAEPEYEVMTPQESAVKAPEPEPAKTEAPPPAAEWGAGLPIALVPVPSGRYKGKKFGEVADADWRDYLKILGPENVTLIRLIESHLTHSKGK